MAYAVDRAYAVAGQLFYFITVGIEVDAVGAIELFNPKAAVFHRLNVYIGVGKLLTQCYFLDGGSLFVFYCKDYYAVDNSREVALSGYVDFAVIGRADGAEALKWVQTGCR